jgi:transcriptional regulator with XRE-family HTH domain
MKDIETQHRFLELRAQGKSLRTVAEELAVGRQTLVRWEREYKEQIENLKAMELDALLERHRLTVQAQIERYGVELKRVTEELQKRDLADVPTPKLYDIMVKLHARVDGARPALTVRDDDEIADQKALRELVTSRRTQEASETTAHARQQGNGDGTVRADDLVTLQLSTLQRFRAGEIDEHAAMTEIAVVNSLLKGIELTSVQEELQHIKDLLHASSGG